MSSDETIQSALRGIVSEFNAIRRVCMTKKKVAILAIVLSLVVVIGVALAVFVCSCYSWFYSEEQHLARITERAEERFLGEGSEYTDLEVYPVYNEHEELQYALIELAPEGFMYVYIADVDYPWSDMYTTSDIEPTPWTPFRMVEKIGDDGLPIEGSYKRSLFVDENGEPIVYNESHFKVAVIENERRYLLSTTRGLIPAVKRGDNVYLDLWDGALIEYYPADAEHDYPAYASGDIGFIAKPDFDL